MWLLLQ